MCFFIILHNIRSALNVGSILRTADAVGVSKVYVTGYTPRPDNPKVVKTSLGAEKSIDWEQYKQIGRLLARLKKGGVNILALEQDARSKNLFSYKKPKGDVALIVGNEVKGINKSVLEKADSILEIPMKGTKESLNVSVAAGIALYQLTDRN